MVPQLGHYFQSLHFMIHCRAFNSPWETSFWSELATAFCSSLTVIDMAISVSCLGLPEREPSCVTHQFRWLMVITHSAVWDYGPSGAGLHFSVHSAMLCIINGLGADIMPLVDVCLKYAIKFFFLSWSKSFTVEYCQYSPQLDMQWGLCSYVRLYAWPPGHRDAICFIPKMALLALLTDAFYQCGYHALKLLAAINCATRWVIPLQHCAEPMCSRFLTPWGHFDSRLTNMDCSGQRIGIGLYIADTDQLKWLVQDIISLVSVCDLDTDIQRCTYLEWRHRYHFFVIV